MRTMRNKRRTALISFLFLLLFGISLVSSSTIADNVQGYTIQPEHGICFVGDTMNISATGRSFDMVSLILFNSTGNKTHIYILQLNVTGNGVRHIATDSMKPDTYVIELAVRNAESNIMEVVANTTVTLVYDPVHILEKHVNLQDDKILKLMKDNQELKELYKQKYYAMRNLLLTSLFLTSGFFFLMIISIDWTGTMSRNKGIIIRKLPIRVRMLFGDKGMSRGAAFSMGKEPRFYLRIQREIIKKQIIALREEHEILTEQYNAIKTAYSIGALKDLKGRALRKKIKKIKQSIEEGMKEASE